MPVTVANAALNATHGTPGTYGSRMTFHCHSGHKFADMMTAKTIECTMSNSWTETLTGCDRKYFVTVPVFLYA